MDAKPPCFALVPCFVLPVCAVRRDDLGRYPTSPRGRSNDTSRSRTHPDHAEPKGRPDEARGRAPRTGPAGLQDDVRAREQGAMAACRFECATPCAANSSSKHTHKLRRREAKRHLGDWLVRPLDAITRRDVEHCFGRVARNHGWPPANRMLSLSRWARRRPAAISTACATQSTCARRWGRRLHRKARRGASR